MQVAQSASPRHAGQHFGQPDPVMAFTAEARSIGLVLDYAVDDDKIHRVPVEGKGPRNTSGSFKLRVEADGFAFGWAVNWVTDQHINWCSASPSPERDAEWAARKKDAIAEGERQRNEQAQEDLAKSMAVWHRADTWVKADHPYLVKKRMPVQADWRQNDDVLLIPAYDRTGALVAYERIYSNGDKRACKGFGGNVDAFYRFDGYREAVAVCEGVATAWAVHEATGWTVYVARSASRMKACLAFAYDQHPSAFGIALAGDNDANGTGQNAATDAVTALLAKHPDAMVWAKYPDQLGDWWDVLDRDGVEAVKRAIISTEFADQSAPSRRQHALVLDDKNRPIWNTANALTVLSSHAGWAGVFGYDELSGRRVVLKSLPDSDLIPAARDLIDDDYTAVRAWFNRNGYPRATAEITCEAVRQVARLNSFDPLTEYLDGLQWDGQPRIGTWLIDYLGIEDGPQRRAYGRKWLISAVARAYRPGCKADYMLVLEGEQGLRKSSVVRALTGDDWFSDNLPPMGTKDASEHLAGQWVIEVAELDSMSKAGIEAAKAFITRQTETFRPAYGREVINQPRRCVFVGTTNRDNWLNDSSGGRRFWPVRVGRIDIDAVIRDRDQIWAEAVAAYRAGETWWLDDDMEALARLDQVERRNSDPWESDIADFINGKTEVCPKEILSDCLLITADRQDRRASARVATVLQALGWRRNGQITSGRMKSQAKYVPIH